jgi:hypothetical protein
MTTETHPSPEPFVPADDDDEWLRESLGSTRRWPRLTLALAAAAVAAIAFMAGVLIEKNYFAGSGTGGSGTAGFAGRFAGRFGVGATGATGSLTASGVTIGQVKVINGKTFYVTDTSGNTVKVAVTASSHLTAQKAVKIQDLHPGDTVTVRGVAGADGTINAANVAIGTSGGGFGGLGRGSGAAGGGSSGSSG